MKCKSVVLLVLSMALVALIVYEPSPQIRLEDYEAGDKYFSGNIQAEMSAGSYQNLSVTGDIVVEDGIYLIENMELHLVGNIITRNDATVIVRNAKLAVTTQGETLSRDRVLMLNRSRFIAENATIVLKSHNALNPSYVTARNEALVNITHSELHGYVVIGGWQDSKMYLNNSSFKDPRPGELQDSGVTTSDNSTARIESSELGFVGAWGNSSIYVTNSIIHPGGVYEGGDAMIEIENSDVGFADLDDNCTLGMTNSTASGISFRGSVLSVEDSQVKSVVRVYGNSTTWLKRTSVGGVQAYDSAQIWLINSAAKGIDLFNDGKVYLGLQLPLFGTVSIPYDWFLVLRLFVPVLIVALIMALLALLNRRWQQWQLRKAKQTSGG